MTKRITLIPGSLFLLVACGGATSPDGASSSTSSPQSPGSSGDVHGCTTIGCVDGLRLSLDSPKGWTPGAYVFTVVADGSEQRCEGALPLPACGTPGLVCKGQGAAPMIGESGCALPPSSHAFGDMQLTAAPASVKVKIERDGQLLAEQSFTPTYTTSRPNGPSCDPVCKQASATLVLQ